MIEERDGKTFYAADEKWEFAISMPLNRAVRVRSALFSTFLVIWCLAAGCELFTSAAVIIIMSQGGELIRAASSSTEVIFTFVTEGWQSSRKEMKGEGISSALLVNQTYPWGWSHWLWHETRLHLHFDGSSSQKTCFRTAQWIFLGWNGAKVGLCRWWAVQEPILTGSVKTTPPLNHPVGHGSQWLLSAASFHSELFCFAGTLWLIIAFNDNWEHLLGATKEAIAGPENTKSSLERTDAREAPINSWLHNCLCFLERNDWHHFACWKDLFFVVGVVIEAGGSGMRPHGCKQLSAILSCKAISLMLQLIWKGKGSWTQPEILQGTYSCLCPCKLC